MLHDVEGFDHKEVGRMLGIAEGTSKSQVFKARIRLREQLRGRYTDDSNNRCDMTPCIQRRLRSTITWTAR